MTLRFPLVVTRDEVERLYERAMSMGASLVARASQPRGWELPDVPENRWVTATLEALRGYTRRESERPAPNPPDPPVGLGGLWVWEPLNPRAWKRLSVLECFWNGEEWWVRYEVMDVKGITYVPSGEKGLIEAARWMESCVIVEAADGN